MQVEWSQLTKRFASNWMNTVFHGWPLLRLFVVCSLCSKGLPIFFANSSSRWCFKTSHSGKKSEGRLPRLSRTNGSAPRSISCFIDVLHFPLWNVMRKWQTFLASAALLLISPPFSKNNSIRDTLIFVAMWHIKGFSINAVRTCSVLKKMRSHRMKQLIIIQRNISVPWPR